MARIRQLLVVLLTLFGGWQLAAASNPSRACMVLQVQGSTKALLENKECQLKTLQVLPANTTVTVAEDSKLRLTYFKNGRKEIVSGPCRVTIGTSQSEKIAGHGKVAVDASSGSKTLVPESENLRRMGGALHAMVDLGPQQILDKMPGGPAPPPASEDPTVVAAVIGQGSPDSTARNVEVSSVPQHQRPPQPERNRTRSAPKATLLMLAPSMVGLKQNDVVRWVGPTGAYSLKILREDASTVLEADGIQTQRWILPETLKPGQTYTLSLNGEGFANQLNRSFYIWTDSELAAIAQQFSQLGNATLEPTWDELVSQIAFLEARGLLNEALPIAREAAEKYPDDAGLALALGRIQYQLGLEAEAEHSLERAVLLESRQP